MKKAFVALVLLVLNTSLAPASVPEPGNCTVWPCDGLAKRGDNPALGGVIIAPGLLNGTTATITVRNSSNNPVAGALVQVMFHDDIGVCATADLEETTGSNGACNIALRAGGCLDDTDGACRIFANGIEIKNYRFVKSPDNANHNVSAPSGTVTTLDLPYFADEFKGNTPYIICHDYDSDTDCDTADLPYFGDAFKAALACTLQR